MLNRKAIFVYINNHNLLPMRLIFTFCFFTLSLAAQAQYGIHINNFKPGYYYTDTSKKIIGKIEKNTAEVYSDSPEDKYILFKTGDEKTEIKFADIKSFVMDKDSFTISRKKLIAYKVMVSGPVNLYSYVTFSGGYNPGFMGGSGMMMGGGYTQSKVTHYFYGATPDSVVEIKRRNFIEGMSFVMASKPDVVAKIKDKTYTMGWLDELIELYTTGQVAPKPILFKGKNR